ncbi:hypothetical protein CALCODRAFT_504578 [Calocera cornea HHB12733]|uniref:Uncharacterized protein n=1 Tax=Calocera cornea HHB12733 TaxID=1353952 RepID=A0A165CBV5_9BASI|nr:hypothetical protein CALCODRAFT_504578 [Calocera cornea HHB12733]
MPGVRRNQFLSWERFAVQWTTLPVLILAVWSYCVKQHPTEPQGVALARLPALDTLLDVILCSRPPAPSSH